MTAQSTTQRHQRAMELGRDGRHADAEGVLRDILRDDPLDAQAHHNLGTVLAHQGDVEAASACFVRALELDRDYLSARKNLVRALMSRGRHADATDHLREALKRAPGDVSLLSDLGVCLNEARSPQEAAVVLAQACRLKDDSPDVHNSLGLAYLASGRLADAQAAFEKTLRLSPDFAAAHINLATAYKEQGRLGESIAVYEHALRLEPDNPSGHWNLALALLQAGQLERGWREYEWRWRRPASPMPVFDKPLWEGGDLSGKRLLLHAEQGLGDTLQFVRFARLAREAGAAHVILRCQSALAGLMRGADAVDEVVAGGEPLPPFDVHLPLMSAPHRFGVTFSNLPARERYLAVDPSRVDRWRAAMGDDGTFRVGIVWQGNPQHQLDRFRSVPLATFAPLAHIPGCRLFSLQRGAGAEQLHEPWARRLGIGELARTDGHADWIDTAAIMLGLDLVITVDTAAAHLAGALGVPVWVVLSATPDWRWLMNRSDSPWYPSARLHRQESLGEWTAVFRGIADGLRDLVERRRQIAPVLTCGLLAPPARPAPRAAPPGFTVLLGCYGDYPQYSVRALDSLASAPDLAQHCRVLVGLNQCGAATLKRARELLDLGVLHGLVESPSNHNKDPMMRILLEMARTPYVMWMDDDTHFVRADWARRFGEAIGACRPFDLAGNIHAWGPQRHMDEEYLAFARARPWWRCDEHYPLSRKQQIHFPLGGLFVARTEYLRRHDFPDRGMVKWLDDVLLGEMAHQVGGRVLQLSPQLIETVRINDGERRGVGEEPDP